MMQGETPQTTPEQVLGAIRLQKLHWEFTPGTEEHSKAMKFTKASRAHYARTGDPQPFIEDLRKLRGHS